MRISGWWLGLLLILLPAPLASQGDSTTVQVVRVIDGDTDSSDPQEVNAFGFYVSYSPDLTVKGFVDVEGW